MTRPTDFVSMVSPSLWTRYEADNQVCIRSSFALLARSAQELESSKRSIEASLALIERAKAYVELPPDLAATIEHVRAQQRPSSP